MSEWILYNARMNVMELRGRDVPRFEKVAKKLAGTPSKLSKYLPAKLTSYSGLVCFILVSYNKISVLSSF